MGIFEIISAIVLIVACVFIVIVVLMKDTKTQMSQTISGASSDNFFQRNAGKTKEARLNKATIIAAVLFFVLALAVNVINVHFGGSKEDTSSNTSTSNVVTDSSSATSSSATSSDAVSDTLSTTTTPPESTSAPVESAESTVSTVESTSAPEVAE